MPPLDHDSCTRALEARDPRFDGVFFVGIRSTGIYCRPICPARTTLRKNRRFFSSAAAAERAGFRPCLRCRPELAPGLARVDAVPRLVQSAAARIAAGAMNGRDVETLARELGVTGRHLRRAMQTELGVSPIQLAQTHRLLHAKHLLTDTRLPVAQVAYASGFQSVRRLNALFRARYELNPQALRRRPIPKDDTSRSLASLVMTSLTLSYRPPIDWDALLAFLAARATPGVEMVEHGVYSRTVMIDGHTGIVRVSHDAPAVRVDVSASLVPVLMPVCARVRHLFDLDAEPDRIDAHLSKAFGRKLRRGVRVPGAFDGFELAVRAVLGQQVSVRGATTLMARLVERLGSSVEGHGSLGFVAPSAERVAVAKVAEIQAIGLPASRAATIWELAKAVADGSLTISPEADVREMTRRMLELPGIGPWTAEYVAMRAVHWPDAFPSSDLVLRRNAGNLTSSQLQRVAEQWRPWRAYAAMHLWLND
jgi:AraC family transcriptional regulator of adaptative response / DNA-3-methyladenine glycosylase II